MLKMQAHRDITRIHRFPSRLRAEVGHNSLCRRIIPGDEQAWPDAPVPRIVAVLEVLVSLDRERLHDLRGGDKLLNRFPSRYLVLQTMGEASAYWIGAVNQHFAFMSPALRSAAWMASNGVARNTTPAAATAS